MSRDIDPACMRAVTVEPGSDFDFVVQVITHNRAALYYKLLYNLAPGLNTPAQAPTYLPSMFHFSL